MVRDSCLGVRVQGFSADGRTQFDEVERLTKSQEAPRLVPEEDELEARDAGSLYQNEVSQKGRVVLS